ncbi:hypothetical protein L1987_43301 [Smallanthus sonchifolius]|uniref:Uncharacterized protein n=1 Tax=Smallanthus sonchifolius TaxID=185202 RepID=A0ACB9GL88_9ASTR|nr:hypothetical protein L1987_43301 [Smallanthus sonchifolius]
MCYLGHGIEVGLARFGGGKHMATSRRRKIKRLGVQNEDSSFSGKINETEGEIRCVTNDLALPLEDPERFFRHRLRQRTRIVTQTILADQPIEEDCTIMDFMRPTLARVGQIAKAISGGPQGALPSNTEVNPKPHVNVICLRSRRVCPEPEEEPVPTPVTPEKESSPISPNVASDISTKQAPNKNMPAEEAIKSAIPKVPYPGRLIKQKTEVGKFVFPADFVILHMEEDQGVPLILGWPFLATSYTIVDMSERLLTLRVGDEGLRFGVGQREKEDAFQSVEAIKSSLEYDFQRCKVKEYLAESDAIS